MMQYTTLGRTGFKVSKLGLGGAPLGGDFGETDDAAVIKVVHAALDLGITFIDTAPLYGRGESERRIGLALQGRREGVVLATKAVMRGDAYTYDNVMRSVEDSLRRLRTDYVDLIQLHELESVVGEQAYEDVLPAFRKLQEQGKVRAFGVNAGKLGLLLPFVKDGLVDTVQTFMRYQLLDHTAKDELLPLAREKGVGVINGSVLAMGILADSPAPFLQKYPEMLARAEAKKRQVEFLRKSEPKGLIEPAMRFSLSCPDIAVTLTGTTSIRSLERNVSYCDGKGLDPEDQARIFALFQGREMNEEEAEA